MPEIISDTSPLQYLFQTNLLDLLRVLYEQITVPEAVAREIAAGHALGIHLPDLTACPWIQVRQVSNPALLPIAPDFSAWWIEDDSDIVASATVESFIGRSQSSLTRRGLLLASGPCAKARG